MSNNSQGKGDEAMSGEVDYEVMRAVRSIGMTAPKNQFFLQVTEELIRAVEARHDGLIAFPDWEKSKMLELRKVAVTLIKQRWQQQGIWRLCWEETLFLPALQGSRPPTKVFDEDDKWKHEFGHLSSSLRWLMDDEKTFQEGKLRGGSQEDLKQWLKQQEQELAPMTLAEYKKWTKEIEASLPLNMFLHQMNYDNKELLDAGSVGEDAVNTAAYKKTKERWERWGIWSQTWDVLPGMEWRHESLDVNLLRKGGASSDGDRPQSSGDVAVSSSSDTRDKKRKRKEAR